MNRLNSFNSSQGRSVFSGFSPSNHAGPGQSMNAVRDSVVMIVLGGWLLLSSLAAADVLVDQSMMLGQSVEENSHFPGDQNNNFAVYIDKGFVKLNRIDVIYLTEEGSLSGSLCFFSDMGKGEYDVSASSWHELYGGQMAFRSRGDDIPYSMSIAASSQESGGNALQSNSPGATDPSCSTGRQASLTLSVDRQFLPDLWRGSYTDTITLLVHPE